MALRLGGLGDLCWRCAARSFLVPRDVEQELGSPFGNDYSGIASRDSKACRLLDMDAPVDLFSLPDARCRGRVVAGDPEWGTVYDTGAVKAGKQNKGCVYVVLSLQMYKGVLSMVCLAWFAFVRA